MLTVGYSAKLALIPALILSDTLQDCIDCLYVCEAKSVEMPYNHSWYVKPSCPEQNSTQNPAGNPL